MDSLITQLQRRYPLVLWRSHGFGFQGEGFDGAIFTVSPAIRDGRYSREWIAVAAPREGAKSIVVDHLDPFSALEGLRELGGEHMAALEPVDDYSRAQEAQSPAFPAAGVLWLGKGCLMALLPSRWTVLVVVMALGCGALCMGWISGDGS